MAPQLHFHHIASLSTSQAGLAAVSLLLVCSFALFMCASHTSKWRHGWQTCRGSYSHDPVIQLNTDAVVLGVGAYGVHDEQQGVSVWQKNILMGGKCQLPDFSGVIIYDSEGNVVTPTKNPRPLLTFTQFYRSQGINS